MTGNELDIRELNRNVSKAVELLKEIRDALCPPEGEPEEMEITCPKCSKLGRVISNCPFCRGTGAA